MLESDSAALMSQFDCFYLFEESEFTYKGGFVHLLSKIVDSASAIVIRDLDRRVDYLATGKEIFDIDWFDFYDKYNDLQNSMIIDNHGRWCFYFDGSVDSVTVACLNDVASKLELLLEVTIDLYSDEKRTEVFKAVFLNGQLYQDFVFRMKNAFPGIRNGLGSVLTA